MVEKKFNKRDLYTKREADLGLSGLSDRLAKEPLERIKPILIRAARERSAGILPYELLRTYESKGDFYGVSSLDQKALFEFGLLFYSVLPSCFAAVEVSPISPLGLNSVLTKLSQDVSLATIRGSEVVSDSTTPLILECAKRRMRLLKQKSTRSSPVELATMKRVLRLQPFDKEKGYMQHFNLFGICSAGRDHEKEAIAINFIRDHISVWLDFIELLRSKGYIFNDVSVKLSDIRLLERVIEYFDLPREVINRNAFNENFDFIGEYKLPLPAEVEFINEMIQNNHDKPYITSRQSYLLAIEKRIFDPLKIKYPSVRFSFDFARKSGLGYYDKACYHIFGSNHKGEVIQLVDGGSVDWLARITNSNTERAVVSGFGAELIQKLFRTDHD
jgi:hypothetical protein